MSSKPHAPRVTALFFFFEGLAVLFHVSPKRSLPREPSPSASRALQAPRRFEARPPPAKSEMRFQPSLRPRGCICLRWKFSVRSKCKTLHQKGWDGLGGTLPLLEVVSLGSAGHEPADDNENCMRSAKKIYVSQQVIDQQAIRRKNLLSLNNCTVVAWRCCSIWTCSKLFLIPSSQQGKAQQTMSTCTQESTYFACVLEEHTCYCWQVLDQRAS